MAEEFTVGVIGDEHRNAMWRDHNGDHWLWYDDGERRGWKYLNTADPDARWRFGGMHIPSCGPFTRICAAAGVEGQS